MQSKRVSAFLLFRRVSNHNSFDSIAMSHAYKFKFNDNLRNNNHQLKKIILEVDLKQQPRLFASCHLSAAVSEPPHDTPSEYSPPEPRSSPPEWAPGRRDLTRLSPAARWGSSRTRPRSWNHCPSHSLSMINLPLQEQVTKLLQLWTLWQQ